MKLTKTLIVMILLSLLLAACAPSALPATGANQTPPPSGENQMPVPPTPQDGGVPQPPAADAAQQALADLLGIDLDQVVLSEIEQVEWTDSCLGAGGPAESCLQVITPGFRLVFEANNQRYEVRTNEDGSQYRVLGDLPEGVPASGQTIPAVAAAQVALSEQLGIPVDRILLIEAQPVEWTDSCLGAGGPAESCLQVITPGFRIILEVDGLRYQIHTNTDGSILRFVDQATQGGQPGADPTMIVTFAQKLLAQQLGIPDDQISLTTLEAVDWPNACLGVALPEQACAEVITPGYRLIFEAQDALYAFHTDAAGGVIIPAIPSLPETAGTVVTWQQTEGSACQAAEIGVPGVSFGACGAVGQPVALSAQRALELAYFYAVFPSFTAETPAGELEFNGQGVTPPSEAEMRSVAEWASLVAQEAEAGRGSAAAGLVMAWSREGGIAGFCDDLAIYRTGWAMPSSCRGDNPVSFLPYRLTSEELEQLYALSDGLQNFEYEQADQAIADSMRIKLAFTGSGSGRASDAQREEIARFAEQLYTQALK